MTFEEFEKNTWEKGYGIVAMNHYSMNGKRYMYCVVFNKSKDKAIQAEGEISQDVFQKIFQQILKTG
jgi:hypothetical protein